MVDLVADYSDVYLGQDIILTCNIVRGNPMDYTYVWTDRDTMTRLSETSSTLNLNDVNEESLGTYECAVSNVAGTGMDSITIKVGG